MKILLSFIISLVWVSAAWADNITISTNIGGNTRTTIVIRQPTYVAPPPTRVYTTRSVAVRDNGSRVVTTKTFTNGKMTGKTVSVRGK